MPKKAFGRDKKLFYKKRGWGAGWVKRRNLMAKFLMLLIPLFYLTSCGEQSQTREPSELDEIVQVEATKEASLR
jgi:hypothetical protein